MDTITKQQFVLEIVKWIEESSTRRLSGTTDNKYLLNDLEFIEHNCKCLKQIVESEKEEYTWHEREKIKLKWMREDIEKMIAVKE
jgi:hypothetical protein